MGKGNGVNLDLSLILKVLALICCAVTLGLTPHFGGGGGVTAINSFKYSTGGYIIIIGVFVGYALFKGEVDPQFAGSVLAFGFVYMVSAGASVLGYSRDSSKMILIAGILAICAGVVMLIDALKCFKVF